MDKSRELIHLELATKNLAERRTGMQVKMNSQECIDFRRTHDNCRGCQYEPACSKSVALLLATMDIHPDTKIAEVMASENDSEIDFDFEDGE